jgi:hypothetical protein
MKDDAGVRGVHRLAGAILLQAIEDLRFGTGRRRAEALCWIMDDSTEEQFSFRFCCRMLHRDPEQIRRWASEMEYAGFSSVLGALGAGRAVAVGEDDRELAAIA